MKSFTSYIFGQGKREKFNGVFPPMRHPIAFMDFINLFRTLEDLGKKVSFFVMVAYYIRKSIIIIYMYVLLLALVAAIKSPPKILNIQLILTF